MREACVVPIRINGLRADLPAHFEGDPLDQNFGIRYLDSGMTRERAIALSCLPPVPGLAYVVTYRARVLGPGERVDVDPDEPFAVACG